MRLAGYQHILGICTLAYSVAEYFGNIPFDCALSGPFAKQFLTRLSASRALCVVLNDVISASTVYDFILYSFHSCLSIGLQNFLEIF